MSGRVIYWIFFIILIIVTTAIRINYRSSQERKCNQLLKDNYMPFNRGVVYVTCPAQKQAKVSFNGHELGLTRKEQPLSFTPGVGGELKVGFSKIVISDESLMNGPVFVQYEYRGRYRYLSINQKMTNEFYNSMING